MARVCEAWCTERWVRNFKLSGCGCFETHRSCLQTAAPSGSPRHYCHPDKLLVSKRSSFRRRHNRVCGDTGQDGFRQQRSSVMLEVDSRPHTRLFCYATVATDMNLPSFVAPSIYELCSDSGDTAEDPVPRLGTPVLSHRPVKKGVNGFSCSGEPSTSQQWSGCPAASTRSSA